MISRLGLVPPGSARFRQGNGGQRWLYNSFANRKTSISENSRKAALTITHKTEFLKNRKSKWCEKVRKFLHVLDLDKRKKTNDNINFYHYDLTSILLSGVKCFCPILL